MRVNLYLLFACLLGAYFNYDSSETMTVENYSMTFETPVPLMSIPIISMDSSSDTCARGFFSSPLVIAIIAITLHKLVLWIYRKPEQPVPIFVFIDEKRSKAKIVFDGETHLIYRFFDQHAADHFENMMKDLEVTP